MIQSVQRAVRILRELAAGSTRLGVTELADRMGLAKPTVHALLGTLEAEGLVVKDAATSKYQLGPQLVLLGNAYMETQELRSRSLVWADLLATQTRQAVWVAVLISDRMLVVHHAFRPSGMAQILEVGATIPWYACALGKAAAAFAPEDVRRDLLAGKLVALTGFTVTDPVDLERQLVETREVGYAVDRQESALGEASIAAPILDHDGRPVGAIGVVGPMERLTADDAREQIAIDVRETARNLSRDMGAPRTGWLRDPVRPL